MPENLLTKCPHCGTTFRLTQAQLDIAGGAVRCGSCYQVFHAAEHSVKTSVVEERRTVTKSPDPVEEAFDLKSDEGLDPYDSDDLELAASEEDPFKGNYMDGLDQDSDLEEFGYQEKKEKKKKGAADESWAQELLAELGEDDDDALIQDGEDDDTHGKIISGDSAFSLDEDKSKKKKKSAKGTELSDTFKNLGKFDSGDPFSISDIEEDEFGDKDSQDDESWAKAMLEELEDEDAPEQPKQTGLSIVKDDEPQQPDSGNPFAARDVSSGHQGNTMQSAAATKKPAPEKKSPQEKKPAKIQDSLRNDETEEFFRMLDDGDAAPTETKTVAKDSAKKPALFDEPDFEDDTDTIDPDNLFVDSDDVIDQQIRLSTLEYGTGPQDKLSRGTKNAMLAVAMIVLMATLAGQYAWFHFDQVSRIPALRPYVEQFCPMIGCEPVQRSDVSRIAGTNLVVRSHPFEKNALVIDVIIKNQASFAQPYPVVQLNFEDLNGNPIASRRFAPEEYIGDKNIALDSMPQNTPIHLTLEIEDPGRKAVNYQLLFLPSGSPT